MSVSLSDENPKIIKYWRKNPKSIEKYQFVHYFLPHEERKTRATLLSNKAVVLYCAVILLFTCLFRLIPYVAPGVLGYASNINVKDLLSYTNKKRGEIGVSDLKINSKLSEAALKKAQDMFEDGYWAHVSPDGTEPWDFILGQDYDYIYAGENLAKNFSTSKEVVEAWYESPSHKENLLSANYDEVGFAVVNGVLNGYETTLVVQMFGRPRDASQIATVDEEQSVLSKSERLASSTEGVPATTSAPAPASEAEKVPSQVLVESPKFDVAVLTRTLSAVFGTFIATLLAVDIWYSRKHHVLKFTGHTFVHLMMLLVVVASIWFVIKPGVIL